MHLLFHFISHDWEYWEKNKAIHDHFGVTQGHEPLTQDLEFQNLGTGLHGHHHHAFNLSHPAVEVEKNIF